MKKWEWCAPLLKNRPYMIYDSNTKETIADVYSKDKVAIICLVPEMHAVLKKCLKNGILELKDREKISELLKKIKG